MIYEKERTDICTIAKSMYDRWLTNAAGGNLSVKINEDTYLMTGTGLSAKYLWNVKPENILVVDKDLNIIDGKGRLTREINMHMRMYENDNKLKSIIHAHPKELMVYSCMGIDMPIVSEALEFLGESLPCLEYRPATTQELANLVGEWTKEYSNEFNKKELFLEDIYAYGYLLRRHGVIIGAEDIFSANQLLERLETNAYVHINASILEKNGYEYLH